LDLFNTGQRYVPLTIEALRALMQASPDEDDAIEDESTLVSCPAGKAGALEM
jgi:hypothetical protein